MKKIITISSILVLFLFTGCNNQLNDENKEKDEIGTFVELEDLSVNESEGTYVFESTKDCYTTSKDENNVYFDGEIVEQADSATFEEVEELIFKDINNIYLITIGKACEIGGAGLNVIEDVDVDSFKSVNSHKYFKDKYNVYFQNGEFVTIEGADPNSFEVLDWPYSKDKNYVFSGNEIVEGADSETFEHMWNTRYAKDKINAYYFWGEIIEGADANSFEGLDYYYAKDKNNAYFENTAIQGADSATFEVIDYEHTKDKNNEYYLGEIIIE